MRQHRKIKVYYNSACPVCKAGIANQKVRMQGCPVEWNDVHSDDNLIREIDSDLEFVRERLHVVDESGALQIGFDAFLAIWRNSPTEGAKSGCLVSPLSDTCAEFLTICLRLCFINGTSASNTGK